MINRIMPFLLLIVAAMFTEWMLLDSEAWAHDPSECPVCPVCPSPSEPISKDTQQAIDAAKAAIDAAKK